MSVEERRAQEALLKGMSAFELTTANIDACEKEKERGEEEEGEEERPDGSVRPVTPEVEVQDSFRGMIVLSPLRRQTLAAASNPEELEYEVRQLKRLSAYELVRENNIAKHKELLAKLGLDKSFSEIMGLKKSGGKKGGGKRKNSGGVAGRKAKRAKKGDENENDSEEGGDEEEEGEEEEEEDADAPAPAPAPAPRAPRPQRSKPGPSRAAPKEWAVKVRKVLETDAFGKIWTDLVGEWHRREEGKGFVSPVSV